MSSAQTRFPLSPSGTSPATIRWASPSTIAVLPTPGSPMRTGLFFVRRESTWMTRRISSSRPMTGSSFPLSRRLGEVAAELRERLVRALGIVRGDPAAGGELGDLREELVARHDVEREQEVLRGDVLVLELSRLVGGAVEHLRERRGDARLLLRTVDARLLRERGLGLRAQRLRVGNELARQLLVEQREQQVLGIELGIAAPARELLRRGDRFLRFHGELVEVHYVLSGCRSSR